MKSKPTAPEQKMVNPSGELTDFLKEEAKELGEEVVKQVGSLERSTSVTAVPPSPVINKSEKDLITQEKEASNSVEDLSRIRQQIAIIASEQNQARTKIAHDRQELAQKRDPSLPEETDNNKLPEEEIAPTPRKKRGLSAFLGGRVEKKDKR